MGKKFNKIKHKNEKIINLQIKDKSKHIDPSKYILKKYWKILPSDLSDNNLDEREDMIDKSFKTFKDINIKNNNQINK